MSFTDDIQKATDKYRRRLNFVAKDATQRVINSAQQSRFKGGRMPIDTGFLRASGVASLTGLPIGETTGQPGRTYSEGTSIGTPVSATLIRWDPATQQLTFGWTAQYARVMELRYGFQRGAVEQWSSFVDQATRAAQRVN